MKFERNQNEHTGTQKNAVSITAFFYLFFSNPFYLLVILRFYFTLYKM